MNCVAKVTCYLSILVCCVACGAAARILVENSRTEASEREHVIIVANRRIITCARALGSADYVDLSCMSVYT